MASYVFTLDGTPVCDLALESLRLSLRAGGPDTLVWSYQADPTGTPPHSLHDEVTLQCLTYDDDGELTATETLFKGHVTRSPKIDEGTTAGFQYQAENGWGDLRRVVLTQSWKSWNPATSTLLDRDTPRVVLGLATDGTVQTTGDTIEEILDHAEAKGALVTAGTISPALTVPPTELVDATCDAALRQLLAYHPDHVAWIEDGDTLNVRPPSSLATLTVDPCADGLTVSHDPQTDELPGGVVIVWEITHQTDGIPRIERQHQTAGSTSGWPPPLYMTIPLAGTNVTTKKEIIETRTLPVVGSTTAAVAKNFIKGIVPKLGAADNADLKITRYALSWADPKLDLYEDETLTSNARPIDRGSDEITDFPRMLVAGQVQPWFPSSIKQYDALLEATITYTGTDAALRAYVGTGLEIAEPIVITNALPKTYTALESAELGDAPISGLATSYWNAINQARDEGTVSGPLGARWIDLRPGRKVIVTGYFETAAVITAADLDILEKTFSTTYGSSEYLNPKTIADLAKAMARNKPSWRRPEERTAASAEGGSAGQIREGGKASPQYAKGTRLEPSPWSLVVEDFDTGEVSLTLGKILDQSDTHTGNLPCSNPTDTYTPSANGFLLIKLVDQEPTDYQIVYESSWPVTGGYFVETELDDDDNPVFKARYYPLYKFLGSATSETVAISSSVHALRIAPPTHLHLIDTYFRASTGEHIPCPHLIAGHRNTAA